MGFDKELDAVVRKALYAFWDEDGDIDQDALRFALSIDKDRNYKNMAMGFYAGYVASLSAIERSE